MREIKFRGKRIDNDEWVFGVPTPNSFGSKVCIVSLILGDKISYPPERLHDFCIEVIPGSVGQFTELKDINGDEICEGDILRVENHPFDTNGNFNGKYIARWCNESLTYVAGNLLLFRLRPYITIIGNVYDDPELCKKSIDYTEE